MLNHKNSVIIITRSSDLVKKYEVSVNIEINITLKFFKYINIYTYLIKNIMVSNNLKFNSCFED